MLQSAQKIAMKNGFWPLRDAVFVAFDVKA